MAGVMAVHICFEMSLPLGQVGATNPETLVCVEPPDPLAALPTAATAPLAALPAAAAAPLMLGFFHTQLPLPEDWKVDVVQRL